MYSEGKDKLAGNYSLVDHLSTWKKTRDTIKLTHG